MFCKFQMNALTDWLASAALVWVRKFLTAALFGSPFAAFVYINENFLDPCKEIGPCDSSAGMLIN